MTNGTIYLKATAGWWHVRNAVHLAKAYEKAGGNCVFFDDVDPHPLAAATIQCENGSTFISTYATTDDRDQVVYDFQHTVSFNRPQYLLAGENWIIENYARYDDDTIQPQLGGIVVQLWKKS